jgi:hypothetical protein
LHTLHKQNISHFVCYLELPSQLYNTACASPEQLPSLNSVSDVLISASVTPLLSVLVTGHVNLQLFVRYVRYVRSTHLNWRQRRFPDPNRSWLHAVTQLLSIICQPGYILRIPGTCSALLTRYGFSAVQCSQSSVVSSMGFCSKNSCHMCSITLACCVTIAHSVSYLPRLHWIPTRWMPTRVHLSRPSLQCSSSNMSGLTVSLLRLFMVAHSYPMCHCRCSVCLTISASNLVRFLHACNIPYHML